MCPLACTFGQNGHIVLSYVHFAADFHKKGYIVIFDVPFEICIRKNGHKLPNLSIIILDTT